MRLLFITVTALLFSLSASFADYEAGKAAYAAGDYETAYNEWLPLAKKGSAKAQTSLSILFRDGLYVEQNTEAAVEWISLAKDQKHPNAVYGLGMLILEYQFGDNYTFEGVKWLYAAAELGSTDAKYQIDRLLKGDIDASYLEKAKAAAFGWLRN